MPTYFLDVAAADIEDPDAEGIALADDEAARDLALNTLADMVRAGVSAAPEPDYRVTVRTEGGRLVGHVTLEGGWRPG